MDSDQPSVAQRFVHDLIQLRQRAGQPSYSVLERLSKHRLRRATMSDILNGNRVKLPDWRFVAEFVSACRGAVQESGLDPKELGSLADWKRHWDGASGGVLDVRFPGRGQLPSHRQQPVAPGSGGTERPVAAREQDPPGQSGPPGARTAPSVWGAVPPRLPDFVGREAWLLALRRALVNEAGALAVVVQGLPGLGKTQLAVEYAHRNADDYDLVWWVPCDSAATARQSMASLAARLGLAIADDADNASYEELIDLLRRGRPHPRWLLVFDRATDPEQISHLVPPSGGHVIVTSRSSSWEASGDMLELDVFDRAESILFLRNRMHKFDDTAAHRLAIGLADLPLLLEHAVESRIAPAAYLARLDQDPFTLLNDQPSDYPAAIAGEWRALLDRLSHVAPDALELLRLLAFFGAAPIPRESLERGSYIPEISIHEILRDPIRRASAIMSLRRAGLLRLDGGRNLRLHQVTSCLARNLVVGDGATAVDRARHDVHLLLSAADPLAPDDPTTWRAYEDLCVHGAESGAAACPHELARRFVVNAVRFRVAAGAPRAALALAEEALAHWSPGDGGGQGADSETAMHLARAEALFTCGRQEEAFELRQRALATMRADEPRWQASIVSLGALAGAHLRMKGGFAAAQQADEEAVRRHVAEFGRGDPRTFLAVGSQLAGFAIAGSAVEALTAAEGCYDDCRAFYGDPGHPAVLAARSAYGRCVWLSGDYNRAADILAEARAGYRALAEHGMLDEDHPARLVHEIDSAITRRDKGLMPAGFGALADDLQRLHRRCWRSLGANHLQTLAAGVALATVLRRLPARADEAARLLEDVSQRYWSVLRDHPYSHSCAGFLATARIAAAADRERQASYALPVLEGTVDQLAASVGEAHPLTLCALSGLAAALAEAGQPDAALKRGQAALGGFQAVLGPGHPHTLACQANIATLQSRLGGDVQLREARARYAAVLGPAHQDVALFAQGGLVTIDFTPLPL